MIQPKKKQRKRLIAEAFSSEGESEVQDLLSPLKNDKVAALSNADAGAGGMRGRSFSQPVLAVGNIGGNRNNIAVTPRYGISGATSGATSGVLPSSRRPSSVTTTRRFSHNSTSSSQTQGGESESPSRPATESWGITEITAKSSYTSTANSNKSSSDGTTNKASAAASVGGSVTTSGTDTGHALLTGRKLSTPSVLRNSASTASSSSSILRLRLDQDMATKVGRENASGALLPGNRSGEIAGGSAPAYHRDIADEQIYESQKLLDEGEGGRLPRSTPIIGVHPGGQASPSPPHKEYSVPQQTAKGSSEGSGSLCRHGRPSESSSASCPECGAGSAAAATNTRRHSRGSDTSSGSASGRASAAVSAVPSVKSSPSAIPSGMWTFIFGRKHSKEEGLENTHSKNISKRHIGGGKGAAEKSAASVVPGVVLVDFEHQRHKHGGESGEIVLGGGANTENAGDHDATAGDNPDNRSDDDSSGDSRASSGDSRAGTGNYSGKPGGHKSGSSAKGDKKEKKDKGEENEKPTSWWWASASGISSRTLFSSGRSFSSNQTSSSTTSKRMPPKSPRAKNAKKKMLKNISFFTWLSNLRFGRRSSKKNNSKSSPSSKKSRNKEQGGSFQGNNSQVVPVGDRDTHSIVSADDDQPKASGGTSGKKPFDYDNLGESSSDEEEEEIEAETDEERVQREVEKILAKVARARLAHFFSIVYMGLWLASMVGLLIVPCLTTLLKNETVSYTRATPYSGSTLLRSSESEDDNPDAAAAGPGAASSPGAAAAGGTFSSGGSSRTLQEAGSEDGANDDVGNEMLKLDEANSRVYEETVKAPSTRRQTKTFLVDILLLIMAVAAILNYFGGIAFFNGPTFNLLAEYGRQKGFFQTWVGKARLLIFLSVITPFFLSAGLLLDHYMSVEDWNLQKLHWDAHHRELLNFKVCYIALQSGIMIRKSKCFKNPGILVSSSNMSNVTGLVSS